MEWLWTTLQSQSCANWTLCSIVIVPILMGILAFLAGRHEKLRLCGIWITFAVVLLGGLLLVAQTSLQQSGDSWQLSAPGWCGNIGFVLELLVLAVISWTAVKIRDTWIMIFGGLQIFLALVSHFLVGHEEENIVLFRIDSLARILLIVTAVVGSVILIFSIGYMREHRKHAPETAGSDGRFYFFFMSFLGFMIGLVASNNFSFFSAFWEATTFCSYALIGQDGGEARKVNAKRALWINSLGGVFLLGGMLILKLRGAGEDFVSMANALPAVTLLPAVLLCVAAFTKSALFPFQSWLLGAMVAPTPVSALLHAATMVKAGVYLVMRVAPHYSGCQSFMMIIAFCGAFSFAGAALLACLQTNAKKVLAFSTISNLGLVVACAGIESPLAYAAGLSIITFHALSKGVLFLCVGRIEQKIGSREIENMDGMPYKMLFTTSVALIGMMSMLLPPFGMLLSKYLAIEATIRSPFLLVFLVTGSAFTVYFWAKWIGRMQLTGYHAVTPPEDIPLTMKFSLGILAVLIVGSGAFTMRIYSGIFTRMAEYAFNQYAFVSGVMAEQALFPASLVLIAIALGLLISWALKISIRKESIRPPFLCGENAITAAQEQNPELNPDGIRSYDFYSVSGKVEHAVFSSYYFNSLIGEQAVMRFFNWISGLLIIVLIACAVSAKF